MQSLVVTVLMLCLAVIFFQDWKQRQIHVALPVLVFAAAVWLGVQQNKITFQEIGCNAAFFLVILSVLIVYMSVKQQRFSNPFQNYFGLGDLLFYLSVTPLFLLRNYILFFILSMLFAIMLQLLLRKKMQDNTIPLAGFSSLFLILVILKDQLPVSMDKITII